MLMSDSVEIGRRIFETTVDGGVGIFRTDVGYAIVGHTGDAISRIFAVKKRSFSKPCGCFGSWDMFNEIIDCSKPAQDFVRAVIADNDLPLSIVGRRRRDHPIFVAAEQFAIEHATKGDTIDLLMNAGLIHDEIARLALSNSSGVFGSSANQSLTGSKYTFQAIEEDVRAGVDLAVDSGPTKYSDPNGYGSTIIDLDTMRPFRIGIRFAEIRRIAADGFGIDIPAKVIEPV
jgi:tRNA A37 threonylcarbamoyladenosine synthetase subunit TsaC/SUA5/YrdC